MRDSEIKKALFDIFLTCTPETMTMQITDCIPSHTSQNTCMTRGQLKPTDHFGCSVCPDGSWLEKGGLKYIGK